MSWTCVIKSMFPAISARSPLSNQVWIRSRQIRGPVARANAILLPGRVGSRPSGCASLPRPGRGDGAAGVVGGGYALLGCHAHQHLDSDGQIQLV